MVVSAQNHDQVGNRAQGDRLSSYTSFEAAKLAAASMILSPYLPLLFMGEEYGETAPFLYFVSHGDPALVEAVRRGRAAEFASFGWQGEVPDPQAEETFTRSRLNRTLAAEPRHRALHAFHRELLRLRRTVPALRHLSKETMSVTVLEGAPALAVRRWIDGDETLLLLHFGGEAAAVTFTMPAGRWRVVIDSADVAWDGPGPALPPVIAGETVTVTLPPWSAALYALEDMP
jgi:maltooligosyltrehalose trehalohydrolase